jgi:hypothetical protein
MPTYAQLNTNMQAQAAQQLRTFDKTIAFTITAYIRVWGFDNTFGAAMSIQDGPQGTANFFERFEYVNAPTGVYSGYLDSGIYSGNIIYSQDVIDSISSIMNRTIDLLEGQISNRSISALICHASCHGSCHTSRGRR